MSRRILDFLIMIGLVSTSLLFLSSLSADVVLLKDGDIIEGDIVEKTDKRLKIKSDTELLTFSSEEVSDILTEQTIPPLILPEETYKERLNKIDKNDAQAHYELGLFCLKNGLFDEASTEFKRALRLNPEDAYPVITKLRSLEELRTRALCNIALFYYNLGETEKALEYLEELKTTHLESEAVSKINRTIYLIKETQNYSLRKSFLRDEDIQLRLKQDKLPIPLTSDNLERISSFINSMSQEERSIYCRKYLDMGIEYQERAESYYTANSRAQKKALLIAKRCYKIALQEENLRPQVSERYEYVSQKLNQYRPVEIRRGLPVPTQGKRDDIKSMLRALGGTAKTYGSRYIYLGKEFEDRAEKETSLKMQREYLNIAVNCYDIAADYAEEQLSKAIIIVHRQRALKKLNTILRTQEQSRSKEH